ncbi:RICIN domain-containing protein [Aquimarina sp. RZ0]|uniref:RICIN domain-containing protein n=1 Tax=Aquimarina sp. RZ0 TaxID=2607730 RepID=UPI0011F3C753|nr:RICIN domain-containing protein [Aquimarina sp. RZ0]KAA1248087.1 RICIN domain-containing protein [Aquimarina sp. RZ0]
MNTNSMLTNLKNYALSVFVLFFSASFAMNANQAPAENHYETTLNQIDPQKQFILRNKTNERRLLSLQYSIIPVPYSLAFDSVVDEGSTLLAAELGSPLFEERIERFEKWRFENLGNNIYQLVNIESGLALDAENENSEPVQNAINTSDSGQRWRVVKVNNAYVKFVNQQTGKALTFDTPNKITQRDVNNNSNQLWRIEETKAELGPGNITDITPPLKTKIVVAPNPAVDFITAVITVNQDITIEIEIVAGIGLTGSRKTVNLTKGENQISGLDIRSIRSSPFGLVNIYRSDTGKQIGYKTFLFQK